MYGESASDQRMYHKAINIIVILFLITSSAMASGDTKSLERLSWAFDGMTGKFDRESIQRGFKVYREVCSACHSIKALSFRNLTEISFNEDQVKSIASEYSVQDGPNDQGAMYMRPGRASDAMPGPYTNDKEARVANNGALPPDLSLIVKAREGGADYIYGILTGFTKPPAEVKLGENMYYNPHFSGGQIAMPPPLISNGQVSYTDGTNPTVEQMAFDVVNFLQWIAEPEMEDRKRLGIRVLVFTIIFTIMFYFAKKVVWKRLKK